MLPENILDLDDLLGGAPKAKPIQAQPQAGAGFDFFGGGTPAGGPAYKVLASHECRYYLWLLL